MPKIVSDYIELHIYAPSLRKYLLLKRAESNTIYPGIWQMITAKTEENENTKDTLVRELKEEAGLTPAGLYIIPRINSFYLEFADAICLSAVFLTLVKNTDVKISDEHSEYKWVTFNQAAKMIYWEDQIESLRVINKYVRYKKLFRKLRKIEGRKEKK